MTQSLLFAPEQLSLLDKNRIPRHVAIIPDGNRRWAKNQQTSTEQGHREGSNAIIEIVKAAKDLGVKILTFYLFSTENWTRPKEEIAALMWLLEDFLYRQTNAMLENNIRLQTIGDLERLPPRALKAVNDTMAATRHCDQIEMVLALNYGSRDEICRAVKKIVGDCCEKKIHEEEIDEDLISKYLDTSQWLDPDLLIRTSGEIRVSNFLLWQISYTEIYVADVLWPDFKPANLLDALINFQKRERRLGGT